MSSSKKKQLRNEQYMTERQAAAAAEAKKLKRYTLTFWVVIALVACIFVVALAVPPIKNVVYSNTDAVTVGEHTLTAVELNYFYNDAISNFQSNNSTYIQYGLYNLNLSTKLNKQTLNSYSQSALDTKANLWSEYFLESAADSIKETYALYDLAISKGHKMTEDEQSSLNSQGTYLSLYAQIYGYDSTNAYLRAVYGSGANEKSYLKYLEVSAMASSYYSAYSEELKDSFNADDLLKHQEDDPYTYNSYSYQSYYIPYTVFEQFGTKDKDGKVTFTDEQKKQAAAAAKEAADNLAKGEYATVADFKTAVKAWADLIKSDKDKTDNGAKDSSADKDTSKDDTSKDDKKEDTTTVTNYTDVDDKLYTGISSLFQHWLTGRVLKDGVEEDKATDKDYVVKEERKEGDLTVIESASGSGDKKVVLGYYVLRYESVTANDYALKDVRHLLVKFKGGTTTNGTTTYSDAEKKAAKEKAEKLLKEWEEGKKTEDTLIELIKKNSDDGNAKEGGLYEDIYPGQMVESFEDWCYDDNRKEGDYGIIETSYGYHIMYFVGNSKTTYRDYMIRNSLHSETLKEWKDGLVEAMKLDILTDKYVEKDKVLKKG